MKIKPRTEKVWLIVNENGYPFGNIYYQRKLAVKDAKDNRFIVKILIVKYKLLPIKANP